VIGWRPSSREESVPADAAREAADDLQAILPVFSTRPSEYRARGAEKLSGCAPPPPLRAPGLLRYRVHFTCVRSSMRYGIRARILSRVPGAGLFYVVAVGG